MDARSGTVIVFTGGDPVDHDVPDLPADAFVVAADSGLDAAHRLGRRVDVAIGDFDSASAASLERAADEGTVLERHPAAKDMTDFELALDVATARAPHRLVVVGGHAGRLDHLLANALALASPSLRPAEVDAFVGPARLHVVHDVRRLTGEPGELVTLLPVGGPATGVVTEGLVYPLRGERLDTATTRGVSNQFVRSVASIRLVDGVLLVVRPGEHGPRIDPAEESP